MAALRLITEMRSWFNSIEALMGFVISENGNAEFYVLVRRGHEFLYSDKRNNIWL